MRQRGPAIPFIDTVHTMAGRNTHILSVHCHLEIRCDFTVPGEIQVVWLTTWIRVRNATGGVEKLNVLLKGDELCHMKTL